MSMPGKYDKTLLGFIKERMGGVGARNANFIAKDVTENKWAPRVSLS